MYDGIKLCFIFKKKNIVKDQINNQKKKNKELNKIKTIKNELSNKEISVFIIQKNLPFH